MKKEPLSTRGVTSRFDDLYALPDADLYTEINLMNADLKGWILNGFTATKHQVDFITGWSSAFTKALTGQLTRTMEHRWPVHFLPEVPDFTPKSSKWIRSKEENVARDSVTKEGTEDKGSLTITTGY